MRNCIPTRTAGYRRRGLFAWLQDCRQNRHRREANHSEMTGDARVDAPRKAVSRPRHTSGGAGLRSSKCRSAVRMSDQVSPGIVLMCVSTPHVNCAGPTPHGGACRALTWIITHALMNGGAAPANSCGWLLTFGSIGCSLRVTWWSGSLQITALRRRGLAMAVDGRASWLGSGAGRLRRR